jgi:hypothetical protein
MLNRITILSAILVLLTASVSTPKIIQITLSEMVQESSMIFVGKVVRIVEETEVPKGEPYRGEATISVEQVIKGPTKRKISVSYLPGLSISPDLRLGFWYVLFIREWKGSNITVRGYGGAIPIVDGKVRVSFILGEEENQTLDGFIQRIKSASPGDKKNGD